MILYLISCAVAVLVFWLKWHFSYWRRSGVENSKAIFSDNAGQKIFDSYFDFKRKGKKHGGTFIFFSSIYIPVDLEVMKNIMQTDFEHFVNRGLLKDPPPLLKGLVNMDDEEWKTWRTRLTPTFTSGKMKMMFNCMKEKALILGEVFKESSIINEAIDIKDIFSRYTTDVISSTIFGLECNSMKKPNEEFRKFGKRFIDRIIYATLLEQVPKSLLNFFKIKYIPDDMESFFMSAIKNTIEYREKNNIFRKDFMHMLIQMKNRGKITDDESVLGDNNTLANHITLDQIAAQCLVFFAGGYETSGATLSFGILELAQNQEIQDKVRTEVRNVIKEIGGELTYESVMKMEYLDKVVQEILRKHPPLQFFPRVCNADYAVPGTDYVIRKEQQIVLPFRAIHYDPEYWPEPEKFDPERFSTENKANRNRFAYLPFGEGPRMCIGTRFGLLEVKTALASILKDFRLRISEKNSKPIKIDYSKFIPTISGILWIDVEKVD